MSDTNTPQPEIQIDPTLLEHVDGEPLPDLDEIIADAQAAAAPPEEAPQTAQADPALTARIAQLEAMLAERPSAPQYQPPAPDPAIQALMQQNQAILQHLMRQSQPAPRQYTAEEKFEMLQNNPDGTIANILTPVLNNQGQRIRSEMDQRLQSIESAMKETAAVQAGVINEQAMRGIANEMHYAIAQKCQQLGFDESTAEMVESAFDKKMLTGDGLQFLKVDPSGNIITGHNLHDAVNQTLGEMLPAIRGKLAENQTKGRAQRSGAAFQIQPGGRNTGTLSAQTEREPSTLEAVMAMRRQRKVAARGGR